MTINIELNSRADRNGLYTVFIRLTEDKKHRRIKTDHKVKRGEFNSKAKYGQWIRSQHPDFERINNELDRSIRQFRDKGPSGGNLFAGDFLGYSEDYIKQFNNPDSLGTYQGYKSKIQKIEDYLGHRRLSFDDITPVWIRKYTIYLKQIGNGVNTIGGDLKKIRAIYNQAVKDGVISGGNSPFLNLKIKNQKAIKERLTIQEIKAIEKLRLTAGSVLDQSRDIFIFCINTLGMRIGDALLLKVENLHGDRLQYRMRKTKDPVFIKLTKTAHGILIKHSDKKRGQEYIFGFMDRSKHAIIYEKVKNCTALVNKCLKEICEKCEIKKKVSSHVARYTWTQLAVDNGANSRTIQHALGHASVNTTEVYMESFSQKPIESLQEAIFNKKKKK